MIKLNPIIATALYVGIVLGFGSTKDVLALPLNALGDFLAGAFAPLAFFWLVLGYRNQVEELKQNSKAINLQAEQLRQLVLIERRKQFEDIYPFLSFRAVKQFFDNSEIYADAIGFQITNIGSVAYPKGALLLLKGSEEPHSGYSIRVNDIEGAGKILGHLDRGFIWFFPGGLKSGRHTMINQKLSGEIELAVGVKSNDTVYLYFNFEIDIDSDGYLSRYAPNTDPDILTVRKSYFRNFSCTLEDLSN